jgi:hypothetical protein
MEETFSVQFMLGLHQELVAQLFFSLLSQLRVAVERTEMLVAEARESSGTLKKGNVCHWKLLPSNS